MRYLIQLVIPALIFVGVVYLLSRRSDGGRDTDANASDSGVFLIILTLGAIVAVATAFALQSLWE
jgi:hypothetical protein